jgi:glucose/arabinose dehydrogenase
MRKAMLHVSFLYVATLLPTATDAQAALLDPAWTQTLFSTNSGGAQHTGLAWAPDGSDRLFVLEKTGRVRVLSGATTSTTPTWTTFATMSPIHTNSECGLIGMAFAPDFATSQHVYFFVTTSSSEQQILRYTAQGNIGSNRTLIIGNLPTAGFNHDGGGIGFGADGKLYFAIGDLGSATGVDDDLNSLASKVGRANREGTAVVDNPFHDNGGPNNDYIWARGFRNPFTMTFQPETGALWLNVVGTGYEQIFVVTRGGHGGYNDYENNQPSTYLQPVIVYRTNGTDTRTIPANGAVRNNGVATFTTSNSHGFRVGGEITISGVSDSSFNTTTFIASVPTPTSFTITQAGANASSGGGNAQTAALGGSLTGGTFYDATLAPESYRGNFFFGDYNSGNLMRATLDPVTNAVRSVAIWANGLSSLVDVAPGPDGALYYTLVDGGNIYRAAYNATQQAIVVSGRNLRMDEAAAAVVTVSLAIAPSSPVTVNIARISGDTDVGVQGSSALTFTATNWRIPQAVTFFAASDVDTLDDAAVFRFSAAGLVDVDTTIRVTDRAQPDLIFRHGFEN